MDERLDHQSEKEASHGSNVDAVGVNHNGVVESIFDILELVTVCPHCSTKSHIVPLEDGRCQSCGFVPELDMDEHHLHELEQISSFMDTEDSAIDEYFQAIQLGPIKGIHKVSYKMHEITEPKHMKDETLKRKLVIDYDIVKMVSHRTQKKSPVKLRVEYEVMEKIVQRDLFDGVERNTVSSQQLMACNIVSVARISESGLKKIDIGELYDGVSIAIKRAGKQIMETYIGNS